MNKQTTLRPLIYLSWQRIRQRPFQYLLFILGVALGVAMMVSIDLANGSASRAFSLSTNAITGKTTDRIIGSTNGVPESIYQQLRTEVGYHLSAPIVEGYIVAPQLGTQPFRLLGVDPFAEPPFRSYLSGNEENSLNSNDWAALITEPNSLLISESIAAGANLSIGEQFTVTISGVRYSVIVGGLLPTNGNANLDDFIFTDIATAQELLNQQGRLSHIDLIVTDREKLTEIEAILPPDLRIETAAAQSNTIQQMTAAFETNLTALSLLALVVGIFLIYNTVNFSLVQRRPLFSVLRCLGVTPGQLCQLILAESALLGLFGSLIGLLLGILLGRFMILLVSQTINDFFFVLNVTNISISSFTLIKGLIIGVGAALLGSLPPAIEALQTTPNTGLKRSSSGGILQQYVWWLIPAWLFFSLIGALCLAWDRYLVLNFAGLFIILISFALLTPPVIYSIMPPISKMGGALFGPLARLAPRNIARSLSRTSVATAALMLAVSVIVGISIMIGSFRQTVVDWLSSSLQADIFITPPTLTASRVTGTIKDELLNEIIDWPGVDSYVLAHANTVYLPQFEEDVELVGANGDVSEGKRKYAWKGVNDPFAALAAQEGVIISEPFILRHNIPFPPPPIELTTPDGVKLFPIIAVYYDYSSDRGSILIDMDQYQTIWHEYEVTNVGLFMEEGVDIDATVSDMKEMLQKEQNIQIQSNVAIRTNSIEIFDRTFAITVALQLLATTVAFIGVLSALMSLQLEKAKELGILRATGMTVRQLWTLTFLETGLMGLLAAFLAMPTGYILSWILIHIINIRSFGWTLDIDLQPSYFLQAILVALVASILAAIYPSIRLSSMVITSALRED